MTEKVVLTQTMEETSALFGINDANIQLLESHFGVEILGRDTMESGGNAVVIRGESEENVRQAYEAVECLARMARLKGEVSEQNVAYVISMITDGKSEELQAFHNDCICMTTRGKPISAKTLGQKQYVDAIRNNTIILGIGPAGTGKTFLAVAMAVTALRNKEVERIVLTRPAVEAGEKLGFLPGDLQNKIDPYLRPLYDALYEMLGQETYQRYTERGIIEVAPLAYMRGRTLDDSFIILDEAQNTTPEQMKMFLTRIGFGSKAVVTRDITQVDLPKHSQSGLLRAEAILSGIDEISFHHLTAQDVVRHPVVAKIIAAYRQNKKRKGQKLWAFLKKIYSTILETIFRSGKNG